MDYVKRFAIAGIMGVCVSLLFLGGRNIQAEMIEIDQLEIEMAKVEEIIS
ncbi:hypothetical protein J2Z40_001277 [Cytobacillus eiseniae]|uniref:TMhelix containing protein n=1 Tax=Cytobacillus eiseniae TaxID=762947 RepID=A0ABS4RCT9_9BACI|nr:hypothetical protein [Cytobacillus eiseniae]MBP2240718.1 hypothetical protein [Cytobacillus eiseniae]